MLFCLPLQHDLDDPERGMIFVSYATHKTKVSLGEIVCGLKDMFFIFNVFQSLPTVFSGSLSLGEGCRGF